MLKRIILALVALLGLGAAGLFLLAPLQIDKLSNKVLRDVPLAPVSEAAAALHDSLLIVDLHADPLLWKRDLSHQHDHGHTDLPRLADGNVSLQVMASVTKVPWGQNYDSNPSDSDMITPLVIANGQPMDTWSSLLARSLHHADKLYALQAQSDGKLQLITSTFSLGELIGMRRGGARPVGALLALEGAQPIEGDVGNLDVLFAAGYRMVGLAHFFDNEVAGSMHGEEKYGLTALGRELVARAEELGMVIDIAHASPATVADVFDMATRPVVVSHGGVQAVCNYNRNLTDEQLHRLAANGGVIGIGYWDAAVCDSTPAGIVKAMSHVRDLVGIEHIALGSDFDGAVATRFDTSQLAVITQALLDAGYSQEDIRAVMGGNAIRVLRASLP